MTPHPSVPKLPLCIRSFSSLFHNAFKTEIPVLSSAPTSRTYILHADLRIDYFFVSSRQNFIVRDTRWYGAETSTFENSLLYSRRKGKVLFSEVSSCVEVGLGI